jgi:hypothetical protein
LIYISQSETRIALGSHICWQNGTKRRNFIENQQTWPTRAIRFSDWLLLKKSPLKLLGQMEPNLAGSIYASILHRCFLPSLVPFGQGVSGEKI